MLAALLHALPLKEDLEEWVTIGRLFSFLYQSTPDQVTSMLEPSGEINALFSETGKVGISCS